MNAWDELVAGAVLGTERRPPAPPESADPRVNALLAAIDWADAEGALLAGAAALALYREAGRRAARDTEPPPVTAAPETRPRCGAPAGDRLAELLDGHHRALLPEWLRTADARGLRAPEELLPALLELARWQRDLRELVVAVAGERGRWLARINPDWAYAAAAADRPERDWATAPRDARPLLLTRLRRADPAVARELLERSWPTEAAADRAALLDALGEGLSMADEPFVEAALDDRRKEVRRAAAGLLTRLPQSRLAGRMADRLRPLVHAEGTARKRLVADLPAEVDAAMARDGIVAKPPAGDGERAWWLRQLVAAAPLSFWAAWGTPSDVIRLGSRADAAELLLAGWCSAAVTQRDARWAAVLHGATGDPDLVSVLDRPQREQLAQAMLADRRTPVPAALAVLGNCTPPWGRELSGAVVRLVARLLADTGAAPDTYRLREAGPRLAAAVDPEVADDAAQALAATGQAGWSARVASTFVELVTYRRLLHDELR